MGVILIALKSNFMYLSGGNQIEIGLQKKYYEDQLRVDVFVSIQFDVG